MKDGWLWLSILKMQASPSPMSMTPAFSPGPQITRGPLVGNLPQVHLRGFVGAVLGPHHREDAQFDVVGLAAQPVRTTWYSSGLRPYSAR
jgi:hypothetical protein